MIFPKHRPIFDLFLGLQFLAEYIQLNLLV